MWRNDVKVILNGMMGTGKSSLGRAVAASLELPFFDSDACLEAESGLSVANLFAADGEAGFREREANWLRRQLNQPGKAVVAVGGGTLLSRSLRHQVLEQALVVTLTAGEDALHARLRAQASDGDKRPLLSGGDLLVRLRDLVSLRAHTYAEAHAQLATDADSFTATTARLTALCTQLMVTRPVCIPLGERSYNVYCVHDAYHLLRDVLAECAPSSLLVLSDANVQRARADYLDAVLSAFALPITALSILPGEQSKTRETLANVWDMALGATPDRNAVMLAFGGGVVGDLAGFAAATTLRGIRVVQVPTSLLAMLDSSVGGKTGIDHVTGKNRIGAMHQPSAVVCDTAHLATLPLRELRAGLAEIIKVAAIADVTLFEDLEAAGADLLRADFAGYTELVRRGVVAKMRFVRDDENERGARKLLNFGHTVGHALEAATHYACFLHGEAVALGMASELALGVQRGITAEAAADRTVRLLEHVGLPVAARADDLRSASQLLRGDKKLRGSTIEMPWVAELGVGVVHALPVTDLRNFMAP
jgi:shikimate kinase / 3-dehydroquinate synthase